MNDLLLSNDLAWSERKKNLLSNPRNSFYLFFSVEKKKREKKNGITFLWFLKIIFNLSLKSKSDRPILIFKIDETLPWFIIFHGSRRLGDMVSDNEITHPCQNYVCHVITIHFRISTLLKGMNPFVLPAMDWIVPLRFYKDSFGIK